MRRKSRGFSFIELTIVVMILGILVAIAMPSFSTMQERAKEGSTKANMHTFQLAAEAYAAENHGAYAPNAGAVAVLLPGAGSDFHNPFDHSTGNLNAWENVTNYTPSLSTSSSLPGIVAYGDSATLQYVIAGRGARGGLDLRLYGGR
jgi:prepilin-type N-terminal cleavage/methylation domain-containing protein